MTSEDEKRRLLRQYKDDARALARAQMVLDPADLEALLEHLDRALETSPCDHSLRHTTAWAHGRAVDLDPLRASLEHFGGYCDCEVTLNVNPEEIFGALRR